MNRFKEGVRLLAFIGGLVIALGAMVGVASADQTIQGTVTAELLNLTSESGTSTIDGNLTVNKDLKVNYPIYAWGNLVKFKGDSKTT